MFPVPKEISTFVCFHWVLASEQSYLAEIILTQLTIKVPNFGPKNSNFACSPKFSTFHFKRCWEVSVSVSRLLPIFGGFWFWIQRIGLGPRLSENKSQFWFRKIWSQKKSLSFGFGKFGLGKKTIGFGFGKFGLGKKVSVSEILVSEKKSRYRFPSRFWYRHSVLGR